jgi:hypothetical protein
MFATHNASLTPEVDAFVDGRLRAGKFRTAARTSAPVCTCSRLKLAGKDAAILGDPMSAALMFGIAE